MDGSVAPDMEHMCRLCLQQNLRPETEINIFSNSDSVADTTNNTLSIPMRIMTCAALEVHATDALPKHICKECRYQLEKSYYFRKRSQLSDSKLRKHIRLLNLGKKSRVFDEESQSDDELEFEDSLAFLKQQDELRQKIQQREKQEWRITLNNEMETKILEYKNSLNEKHEKELKRINATLREQIKKDVRAELIEAVREEVKMELQDTIELELRVKLRNECTKQAKLELREEMREQCRQQEMDCLLLELENFLIQKRSDVVADTTKPRGRKRKAFSAKVLNKDSIKRRATTQSPRIYRISSNSENDIENADKCASDVVESENEDDAASNFYEVEPTTKVGADSVEPHATAHLEEQETQDENSYFSNDVEPENDDFEFSTMQNQSKSTTSYELACIEQSQLLKKHLKKIDTESHSESARDGNDKNVMVFNIEQHMDAEDMDVVEIVSLDEKLIVLENDDDKKHAGNIKHTLKASATAVKIAGISDVKKLNISEASNNSNDSSTMTLTTTAPAPTVFARVTDTLKTFQCKLCPMAFSTQISLDRHERMHVKLKEEGVSHECPQCHIIVSRKSALTRHMLTHSSERPYNCTVCGKSFVQAGILKRHLQTHTGERPYKCNLCDRSFAQKVNMRQHINNQHTATPNQVQQYHCHLCPKRFNHGSGLSRHLASHSGVAFQCTECQRTFGDRSSVKRHIATVHGPTKVVIEFLEKDNEKFVYEEVNRENEAEAELESISAKNNSD